MSLGRFTSKAQSAIEKAQQMALERNQGEMRALHLLYVLLDESGSGVREILEQIMDVDVGSLLKETLEEIIKLPRIFNVGSGFGQMYLSQEMMQMVEVAAKKAIEDKNEYISPEYLFYGILATKNSTQELINKYNIKKDNFLEALNQYTKGEKIVDEFQEAGTAIEKYTQDLTQLAEENKLDPVIGREEELRRVMQILSRRTKNNPILIGEAGVGKTAIVEGLAQRISSSEVPESLVNKRIISLDLGALIAGTRFRGEFEERLKNLLKEIKKAGDIIIFIDEVHTLVGAGAAEGAIDASNLLKPALARGELRAIGAATFKDFREYIEKDSALERRFQPISVEEPSFEEAIEILRGLKSRYETHHGLKISEEAIVTAVQLSSRYITSRFLPDKAIDLIDEAASVLSLEIGSIPLLISDLKNKIKSLELEQQAIKRDNGKKKKNYQNKKLENELKALKKKFKVLNLRWQKEKEVFTEVGKIKKNIEQLYKESQEYEKAGQLDKVAEINYGKIPQLKKMLKAKERELEKMPEKERFLKEEVMAEDIARVVSNWTGVPVARMLEEESKKLMRIEKELTKRVVGQEEAVHAISRAIKRARAGISEEERPIGSFMFLGPTGVGKTELARALAEFMFSNEKAMIRVDMSEYMEKHSVARLIGSPPGYVGYETGGQLTEAVKHRPYSLILFDEIEKAHPEVFNILLQILDNGRLTDGKGRAINFKNTIIIMTSNLGGEYIHEMASLGFTMNKKNRLEQQKEELKEKIHESLTERFRPEFLNRIDEIIIFNSLSSRDIEKIVDLQIEKINHRLSDKKIFIQLTREAKKYLAQKGFSPDYGARPLKRLIEKEILDHLADEIIIGEIKEGKKISVGFKKDSLSLCQR
ncbi:MAG: AAA family ATPase [Candidatus Pacebacteria bacterium]|nr:AAA family ATPase [Candidatus Paceibacterota bacterium]MDD4994384.1 AAA family ATPase [Candidatus Paceibacterota bacterium]MDD5535089.1 AAA family ATPase [Candidatus Paceibacterota bacterium]